MNAPPCLAARPKSKCDRSPAWALMGLLLLLAGARLSLACPIPLPFCLLKRLTGIPCPFCGTTRCLQACSQLDFTAALLWNPLALVAGVGIVAWFLAWAAERLWDLRWLAVVHRGFKIPALKWGCLGVVFLNWIYLWIAHR